MSSYSIALSGLLANTTALDVVGNNLSNMNTQGFKADDVLFEDAFNTANQSLQVGAGVAQTLTTTDFTQGSITSTGQPLDAAIQGTGFFIVQGANGDTAYTRDGSFSLNATGELVTSSGDLVQGWTAVNGVLNPSGATSSISIPALSSTSPSATANMTITANLDASSPTGTTFTTPIQVVDSLGNNQTLSATFTETAANTWTYNVTIPGQDIAGGVAGTPSSLATGTLTFNSSGQLTSPAAGAPIVLTTTGALADGASALTINWNLYNAGGSPLLTQFAEASASTGTTQDGVQPATATSVALQDGGELVASYSNGQTVTIAQLAVASIGNANTLIAASNNNFTLGGDTTTPSVGAAGTGDRGTIVGQSLESSNVDMATEFTNLIVYQRGYEAGSKIITTQNQMDQMLLQIQP
ncbi:MAG TPA: flagellar hook protein FlgE [Bryobacteraceae bacterium]|jgi:flagellar hook protein FlgE